MIRGETKRLNLIVASNTIGQLQRIVDLIILTLKQEMCVRADVVKQDMDASTNRSAL